MAYFWKSRQKIRNQLVQEKLVWETKERERIRIAKDIHDDLGSGLSKINFLSEVIYKETANLPEVQNRSEAVKEIAKKMIDNMRDLIWALNPENTTLYNLIARMREYTTDYLEDFSIELKYVITESIEQTPINKESHRELFMVVKETLNNISKHSKATKVHFEIKITDENFLLTIQDNGIGINFEVYSNGNGLRNMKSRVEFIGGKLNIECEKGKGTIVNVVLALSKINKSTSI